MALFDAGFLDDDLRYELVDGVLIAMGHGGPRHAGIVAWLNKLLVLASGDAFEVRTQCSLLTADDGFRSPDLIVVEPVGRDRLPETALIVIRSRARRARATSGRRPSTRRVAWPSTGSSMSIVTRCSSTASRATGRTQASSASRPVSRSCRSSTSRRSTWPRCSRAEHRRRGVRPPARPLQGAIEPAPVTFSPARRASSAGSRPWARSTPMASAVEGERWWQHPSASAGPQPPAPCRRDPWLSLLGSDSIPLVSADCRRSSFLRWRRHRRAGAVASVRRLGWWSDVDGRPSLRRVSTVDLSGWMLRMIAHVRYVTPSGGRGRAYGSGPSR